MKIKSVMSAVGNGLLDTAAIISNASVQSQINEIDSEIRDLQKQLDELNARKAKLTKQLIR